MSAQGVRVALDVHALQVEGWADRGVGRYVTGYSAALARRGALAAALLAPELPPASGLPNDVVAADLARWDSAAGCRELVRRGQAESTELVYHLTAPFLHTEPGAPASLERVEHWARSGAPRVVLLHDLIPLRAPRHYLHTPGHEERYRDRAEWVGTADLILTNSEHTRREAVDLLGCDPERVATVGIGVSPYFSPPDGTDDQLWRFHFPGLADRPHIVTVAGSDARKGTEQAITALGLLAARGIDLALLVLGHLTPAWRNELGQAAAACGVADRVYFGGAVDDELLRACYRRAVVSLMPSLAEGAGLPVLESAACGTPALASGTSALAETAATPAALFDPTDVGSIADAVAAVVDSPGRRQGILTAQQAVASVSTWGAVADRAVAAIEARVGAGGPGGGAGRPGLGAGRSRPAASMWPRRLALVGWPDGGDATLSELVGAWSGEVDVVSPEPGGALSSGALSSGALSSGAVSSGALSSGAVSSGGVGRVAPSAFGPTVRPASYDRVVYVLTGGPADSWVRGLAGRYAGWLWLRLPPWRSGGGSAGLAGGLEPLVRRSCGVLVDSEAARQAVRMSLRPLAAEPPIVVLTPGREGWALADALTG